MDTQTQIERLIELAIVQRTELKELVAQLPQLREHLSTEIEKAFDETEPQLRAELEEWTTKQTADKTAALGVTLEAKIAELAKSLEISTQARYNAIIAEREQNARLAADAEAKIAEHAASLPGAVKEIVTAELARFPRAGEIEQLRKEFAEPRGLNPRGKWQAGESYNKLDFVTINGDSYTSNIDNNRTRPSRSSADWTLVAARGTGGGGGPTSLSELTTVPSDGDVLIGSGTSWVTSNLTAGAGISITVGPGAITISATDGDITLDDGTAASPSLHFTNDPDTGLYRPAANTLGISVSGTQVAYFDENGLTIPNAGVVAGGSFHGANGNANNPSFSFTSDQDTGFYRHGTNELGISIGGTEKAVMTSTTFSITPNVSTSGNLTVSGTGANTFGTTGKTVIQQLAGSGALAAGGWIYGVDEGLNLSPNGAGLNKKLVMAYFDGSAYRSALEFSNVSSGTATLKLSDYGGLTTVGGNLTVSGAGTSSVAGQFGIGTSTTPEAKFESYQGSTSLGGWAFSSAFTAASYPLIRLGAKTPDKYASIGNDADGGFTFLTNGSASALGITSAKLFANGNLFIGASPVDSANGKLQLATHSTYAGGIGFGPDNQLWRYNGVQVVLSNSSGTSGSAIASNMQLRVENSGNGGIQINVPDASTGGVYFGRAADAYYSGVERSGTNLQLRNGGTTALTLDSSQNSTFAGSVVPSAIPSSKWGLDFTYGSSSGTYVTIANDGTVDLAAGSGMVFIWDDGGSGVSQIMCYYGQTAILWQDSTLYTVTVDTANKVNVYYNSGTSRYRIQNKSGSSKSFNISTIRLRTSA